VATNKTGPTANSTGDRLRAGREALGLTQAELAAALGVHQTMISQYERGDRTPGLKLAGRWAAALGITVDRLLG